MFPRGFSWRVAPGKTTLPCGMPLAKQGEARIGLAPRSGPWVTVMTLDHALSVAEDAAAIPFHERRASPRRCTQPEAHGRFRAAGAEGAMWVRVLDLSVHG